MMTARDPWVNMLRTTVACFAAGVGGADAVTVQPFDACLGLPDGFSRRIARNTQALLLEESHLARVIDPAGGSWYVEQLTDELAQAAWAWFTEIERAGGIVAALDSGLVADRIDRDLGRPRPKRIARRSDPITGVSEFPNLERAAARSRQPAPAGPGGWTAAGTPVCRGLRGAARRRRRAGQTRPTVFLATIGPVAAHTARATFAANLFAAGGIATVTSGAGSRCRPRSPRRSPASGLTVACLCSTDKLYADRPRPSRPRSDGRGRAPGLAGRPAEGVSPGSTPTCSRAATRSPCSTRRWPT